MLLVALLCCCLVFVPTSAEPPPYNSTSNCTRAVSVGGPAHTVTELRFPGGLQTRLAATLYAEHDRRLLLQLIDVDLPPGVFGCDISAIRVYSLARGQLYPIETVCGPQNSSRALLTEGRAAIVTFATVLPSSNASGNSSGAFTVQAQVLGPPSYYPHYRPPPPTQVIGNYLVPQPPYHYGQVDRNDVNYYNIPAVPAYPVYHKPASYFYQSGNYNSHYQPPLQPPTSGGGQQQPEDILPPPNIEPNQPAVPPTISDQGDSYLKALNSLEYPGFQAQLYHKNGLQPGYHQDDQPPVHLPSTAKALVGRYQRDWQQQVAPALEDCTDCNVTGWKVSAQDPVFKYAIESPYVANPGNFIL